MRSKFSKKRGFTLIELLVVISVIGLLSSIILAALTTARKKADEAFVLSSMKQLQNAIELYKLNTGHYPCDTNPCGSTVPFNTFDPGTVGGFFDAYPATPISGCGVTDDFHCMLNSFLVNGSTRYISSVFKLPASFAVSGGNPDDLGYQVNPPTNTSCNGTTVKNYYIYLYAPDHLSMVSNIKMVYSGSGVSVGCLGG